MARELATAGVEFALVGGFAVSVRTEPRFTRDADFAVAGGGGALTLYPASYLPSSQPTVGSSR